MTAKTHNSPEDLLVVTFYLFALLEDYEAMQKPIELYCNERGVRGIILLAREGINSTIAGSKEGVLEVLDFLKEDERLAKLSWKESMATEQPFRKLRVRLKNEIVKMGVDGIDPNKIVGTYVKPKDWNELISDPEVVVIDTRNDYEVKIGTFKNAIDPDIESFGELPSWIESNIDQEKQPKVAMFCTGGIRCEKSTAYLKEKGFNEVFHLEGGILKYLEEVPEDESLWDGECFVFDERVSVGHRLEIGEYELCRACRIPICDEDKASEHFQEGVSCPHCHDVTTDEQKIRFRERQKQIELARQRGDSHLTK
ncbi:MAG: rhodanese-related sulfurtransferase [Planctomycetota bacterium]|nr:rhodanese-related sulfurtransferase [Planctomycetota bacterium]